MKKIILFACFLFVALIFTRVSFVSAEDFGFTAVAEHPSAVNQSTAQGKILRTAFLDGNKIYFGYGDYGANTGPIDIIPFDADSSTFLPKEFTSFTEAIYLFRKLSDGKLYALHTDPKYDLTTHPVCTDLSTDSVCTFQPDFSVKDSNGWTQKMPVGMTHVYDIAELNGKIYLIGSKGYDAVVYESSDGGLNFNQSLSLPAASTTLNGGDFGRFYFAGQLNGKLYVQADDYYGGNRPFSKVFDGVNWADGPDLLPNLLPPRVYGYNSNTFLGNLIYQGREITNLLTSTVLYAFDGNTAKEILTNLRYYYIDKNDLYAIQCSQQQGVSCSLLKTSDLINWELITSSVPSNATSFIIYNGVIFVGASDAKVYKSNFSIKSFSFSLTPRWNLISFPIFASTTTVIKNETVFQSLIKTGKFFEVWLWANRGSEPYTKWSDHWFAWANNDPESNFSYTNQAKSYFIKVYEPVNFSVSGVVNNFTFQSWLTSADLKTDWNMIGFPFENPAPITTALKSIEQQYTKVAYYDKTKGEYKYFYNPSMRVPEYLNDFTQFEPGIGYKIKIGN